MVKFNFILVLTVFLYLNVVFKCESALTNRCPKVRVNNGVVRTRSFGRVVKVTCNWPFKLVNGNEMMTCVRRTWDSENPICARSGCPIVERMDHGRLDVMHEGAKLQVVCDVGYAVDGPSFVYCNEHLEWNDVLSGCKETDRIYTSCDFESSDDRLCGWTNDILNDVDWLADKTLSFLLFASRRHVTPGSSQYFADNYVSLSAGGYGSSTTGRLVSPPVSPPVNNKQKCLVFSYRVSAGTSRGNASLSVIFGGVPHWTSFGGEGRAVIGLYKFVGSAKIVIEGKSCETAIDNVVLTEGHSCVRVYGEDVVSCQDNCGRTTTGGGGGGCSCDWECRRNDNCCADIRQTCPYIKSPEEIAAFYYSSAAAVVTTTTVAADVGPETRKNSTDVPGTTDRRRIIAYSNDSTTIATTTIEYNNNNNNNNVSKPAAAAVPNVTTPSTTVQSFTSKPLTTTTVETPKTSFNPTVEGSIRNGNISSSSTTTRTAKSNSSATTTATTSAINNPVLLLSHTTPATRSTAIVQTNATTVTTTTMVSTRKIDIPPPSLRRVNATNGVFNVSTSSKLTNSTAAINATDYPAVTPSTAANNGTGSLGRIVLPGVTKTVWPRNATSNSTSNATGKPADRVALNVSSTSAQKPLIVFDAPRENHSRYEYGTFDGKRAPANKTVLPNTTTEYSAVAAANRSQPFATTVVRLRQHGPELNYSLHKEHLQNVDKWLTELNAKQRNGGTAAGDANKTTSNHSQQHNGSAPSVDKLFLSMTEKRYENAQASSAFHTITVIKYLAAIGVVLVTFKYILSFVKRYTEAPKNDEMNACFVETDTESCYNMELQTSTNGRLEDN